jgi:hypothetical protein
MKNRSAFVLALLAAAAAWGTDLASCADAPRAVPADNAMRAPCSIVPTEGYRQRRALLLEGSLHSNDLHAQMCRLAQGAAVEESPVVAALNKINDRRDCADFGLNVILRMLAIDRRNHGLNDELRERMKKAVLGFRYWFDEPGKDTMIMYTENHQILFNTAELLAGRLYPNEVFINSGMTGAAHVEHALLWVRSWLSLRGRFGLTEFHSNIYYNQTMPALLNLVDFSEDAAVSAKAAMLLDLIAFDFANNYFKNSYAVTQGRTEDKKEVGLNAAGIRRESVSEAVWLMLGMSEHLDASHSTGTCLVTSSYVLPPILEDIAADALASHEHKERSSPSLEEGVAFGIGDEKPEEIFYWWTMLGAQAPGIVEGSIRLMKQHNMSDGPNGINGELLAWFTKNATERGLTGMTAYSHLLSDVTRGVMLESASTYTFRTPDYQLSGCQDHQKGMCGMQELIWQASLDRYATVITSSGPAIRPGEKYVGGWKPRATLYKNVGVIQYCRDAQMPELESLLLTLGDEPFTHAYFPKWAFDEVRTSGHWTFGRRGKGYVALYSHAPAQWETNDIELRAAGKDNLWIVELGREAENGSFDSFIAGVSKANLSVMPQRKGYRVIYVSPSRGPITVDWDGPMTCGGAMVDLGPYPRYDNKYCRQSFGAERFLIQFNGKTLDLDFAAGTRVYSYAGK